MNITFEPTQKYIFVHVTGKIDLEMSKQMFVKLLGICVEQKLFKVIVDYRDVEGFITIIDRLSYLEGIDSLHKAYLNLGMPKLRIAYLAPRKLDITESAITDRRSELTFDNMATHDLKAAEQWVTK